MLVNDVARICFSDCIKSFNENHMTQQERSCFDICAKKSMSVHHLMTEPMNKIDERFKHLL